ncbi:MAG: DUF262 domain-containing protein [Fusobacteriaceae bacterium]
MNKIDARHYNINEILGNKKYYIDDYQREYRWEKRQIEELLSDLWSKFNEFYSEQHNCLAVKDYGSYFLGSILVSQKENDEYIVDGQQRLTSLSLLVIYLYNSLKSMDLSSQTDKLSSMIYSDNFGEKAFNIEVKDRELCMKALFDNEWEIYRPQEDNVSAINLIERYININDFFQNVGLNKTNIMHFIYWLKSNVYLVKISTSSDDDAYTIFETMNDRGLNLDNTEMLKGYLIANISEDKRNQSNDIWKKRIAELKNLNSEEDSIFFKNWLRARYAKSSRLKNQSGGYLAEDFEKIGNAYHKWVKENKALIGLNERHDFSKFIEKDFIKFSDLNFKIKDLELNFNERFIEVYGNESQSFTLQTMLIFSGITVNDNNQIIEKKIKMISQFIDIFIVRNIVNYKMLGYSNVLYKVFNYAKTIRENSDSIEKLKKCLKDILNNLDLDLCGILDFKLNKQNRTKVHYILARITDYLQTSSGKSTILNAYLNYCDGKNYEIEHILANNYEKNKSEYISEEEFQNSRSKIGNLCLLQNGSNQSIGNKDFIQKKIRYKGENLLLQSLCEETYKNNPNFTNFIKKESLEIIALKKFGKDEIEARTNLYYEIAKKIWDVDNI